MQKPPSNIKAGDVLVYHKGSCSASDAHAVYITKGGTNPKITCHSSEQLDVSYTCSLLWQVIFGLVPPLVT